MGPDTIQTETVGPATVVYLDADFEQTGDASLPALGQLLTRLAQETDPPVVILDLTQLQQCRPQLLGLFVRSQDQFRERSGRLILTGLRQSLRDILRITRLDHVLTLEESAAAAVENLTRPAGPGKPPGPAAAPARS